MKPKRIKKYHSLDVDLKRLFAQKYEDGLAGHVMDFTDPRDQQTYKAVPLETEEYYYLVNVEDLLKVSSLSEEGDKGLLVGVVELNAEEAGESVEEDTPSNED